MYFIIIFRLLYVHSTISSKVKILESGPAYRVWNMGLLKKREVTEIEDGGFGQLILKKQSNEETPAEQINSDGVGKSQSEPIFESEEIRICMKPIIHRNFIQIN